MAKPFRKNNTKRTEAAKKGIQETTAGSTRMQEKQNSKVGTKNDESDEGFLQRLARKRSYIIFSLFLGLLAAAGGIPGIMQMVDYFNNEPKFYFGFSQIFSGVWSNGPDHPTIFLISGTIENERKKPLFIDKYELSVKIKGTIYNASSHFIPESLDLNGDYMSFDLNNPSEHDLLKTGTLAPSQAVTGVFLFATKEVTVNQAHDLDEQVYTLTCVDIKGVKYSSSFKNYMKNGTHAPIINSRTRIKVLPKKIN